MDEPKIPNFKHNETLEDALVDARQTIENGEKIAEEFSRDVYSGKIPGPKKTVLDPMYIKTGDVPVDEIDETEATIRRIAAEVNLDELYSSIVGNSVGSDTEERIEYKTIEKKVDPKILKRRTIIFIKVLGAILVLAIGAMGVKKVSDWSKDRRVEIEIEEIIEEQGIDEEKYRKYHNNSDFNENVFWYEASDFIPALEAKVKTDKDLIYQLGLLFTQFEEAKVDAYAMTNSIYTVYRNIHPAVLTEAGNSSLILPESYSNLVDLVVSLPVNEYDDKIDNELEYQAELRIEEEGFGGRTS